MTLLDPGTIYQSLTRPSATNNAVMTSTEKAPGADVPEVDPALTKEGEDTAEKSKDRE